MLATFILMFALIGFGAVLGATIGLIVSWWRGRKPSSKSQEPWWDEPTESGYSFKELEAKEKARKEM